MYDGGTTIQQRAWDHHEDYSLWGNSALGVLQILCGLMSMALGVGAICTSASGYYIAYGIWCGFVFTLSGGICIGAARHKNSCMIMSNMTLAIVSACLGAIQFSLGVVAAENDAPNRRRGVEGRTNQYYNLYYDIYYTKNYPIDYLCARQANRLDWVHAWGPVDILLLITGFIELVIATIAAILCCQVVCCGFRRITNGHSMYYGNTGTGTTGYSNEGYMADPRLSPSPPLYKVM